MATVRAAGGIVWREGPDGLEVVIVHRPRYDDWSFPKGKRDKGETDEQCAVREVDEETALRCRLGRELLPTRYTDPKGRPKVVRYWEMTVKREATFVPNKEIDDVRWVSLADADRTLSHTHDHEVLASFAPISPTLVR